MFAVAFDATTGNFDFQGLSRDRKEMKKAPER